MGKILVAVGSTRRPKLDAASEAMTVIGPKLGGSPEFEIVALDVPSGVSHTPLSREETMTGARGRAREMVRIAARTYEPWKYFVGLEGGLDVVQDNSRRVVFLQNWAYVSDGSERGYFGQSGAVVIPEPLASRVIDQGIELSQAIDEFAGGDGIRDSRGAWGTLTRDLITRRDAFRIAIINAFAPFFNPQLYRSS